MNQPDRSRTTAEERLLLLLGLVVWLACHPYLGIVHDGRFYAIQALHWGDRHYLADDLYFRYGSQDTFTLFSPIYFAATRMVGLGPASLSLVSIGQIGFWSALVYLLKGLGLDHRRVFLGTCLLSLIPGDFLAEGFVTPRLFAEALALAGLGALVRGRSPGALAALVAAAAIHPLMALPAWAAAWLYLAVRDRRWLLAGLGGGLAAAGAASAGIVPFAFIFLHFDQTWLGSLRARPDGYFLDEWPWSLITTWALRFFLAALVAAFGAPPLRRLAACVIAMAGLAVVITWLGADLAKDVLITQLQPMRAGWLLAVFAVAPLPVLLPGGRPWPVLSPWFAALRALAAGRWGAVAWVSALGCLVAVAAHWDYRGSWEKFIVDGTPLTGLPFDHHARVYWDGGTELLWFKLRMPSYFSCAQGTESVYLRDVAVDWINRARSLSRLGMVAFTSADDPCPLPHTDHSVPTADDIAATCAATDLDWIALSTRTGVGPYVPLAWRLPVAEKVVRRNGSGGVRTDTVTDYYFYQCSAIRRGGSLVL